MAARGELRLGDQVHVDGFEATRFRVTCVVGDRVGVESPAVEGTAPVAAVHRIAPPRTR
jgi:hypothetical protein